MEALTIIHSVPSTKDGIQLFADSIIEKVKEGYENPLGLTAKIKAMEKALEIIKTGIKEVTLTEAAKYGKSFEMFGYKIETRENGTKYDYSKCQDFKWDELDRKKKERENFLKSLKESLTEVDEITGETWKIFPPVKSSTTGLTFTLK